MVESQRTDVQLRQIAARPGFALGAYGPVALSVWDSEPTLEDARGSTRLLGELAKRHERIGLLAVLGTSCSVPDDEVRSELRRGVTAVAGSVGAVANLVEGLGFRSAALRGVLTSMVLMIRPGYPQKIFGELEPAAAFLAWHLDGVEPRDLRSALRALRD